MSSPTTKAAGFVIFRSANADSPIQYLLLKASYGGKHWTPPKGHVDPGESDWLTALRETEEEAGLKESDLDIYKDVTKTLHYEVRGKPKAVVYWAAKLKDFNKPVTLSDEHTEYKWLSFSDTKAHYGQSNFNGLLEEFDRKIKEKMNSS